MVILLQKSLILQFRIFDYLKMQPRVRLFPEQMASGWATLKCRPEFEAGGCSGIDLEIKSKKFLNLVHWIFYSSSKKGKHDSLWKFRALTRLEVSRKNFVLQVFSNDQVILKWWKKHFLPNKKIKYLGAVKIIRDTLGG